MSASRVCSWATLVAVMGTCAWLAGCGRGASPTAVAIGSIVVSERSVEHWAHVIARGAAPPNPVSSPLRPPRQQAISLLIGARWVLAEAATLGLRLSRGQARSLLHAREAAAPGISFRAGLSAVGEDLSDVEFETRIAWALHEVRSRMLDRAQQRAARRVGNRVIAAYYAHHISSYSHSERRFYDLIERIPSKARARDLARRLGSGPRFAASAVKEAPLVTARSFRLPEGEGAVLHAVYSARVGRLVGPLRLRGQYALFVLRRIERANVQPLAEVRRWIASRLVVRFRRIEYEHLLEGYERRWKSRTDCRPGYVVQQCKQYRGPEGSDAEPFGHA
jgi:foldase protein PrsA